MNQPTYASFGARFVALLIDGVILMIVNFFLGYFAILIGWLYYALMESSPKQATVGKMIMKIKVTDLQGNRIGFGKATGRYFGKIISSLIICIGYLMAAWTEKKQALHDIMAGTLVLVGVGQEASAPRVKPQREDKDDDNFNFDPVDNSSHDSHHHDNSSSFDNSDSYNDFSSLD